ncbi:MAG: GntR family transcriptional regulator [Chloroflexota bacterium]
MITVEFRRKEPIYMQIVNQIREQVISGELAQGQQLPTVRKLAADLGVNFNTVARAYRMLDEAGVISTQHGRGTYVLGAALRQAQGAAARSRPSRSRLERLARDFALEAHRQGFRAEQVAEALGYVLEEWDQRGQPVK